jgi:hypothetical protein
MNAPIAKVSNTEMLAIFIRNKINFGWDKPQVLSAAKHWYGHLFSDTQIATTYSIEMASLVAIKSAEAIAQAKEEHTPFTAPFVAVYGYNDPASMWELYLVLTNRMVLRAPEGIEEIISDGRRLVLSDKLEFADTLAD